MKVLVIPEDQELDRYIIKPVIEAMFADLQISARVDILPEPRLRGIGDALDAALLREIVDDNPMTDLFLLVVDRDCNRTNTDAIVPMRLAPFPKMLACIAVQEVEVWMLALHRDQVGVGFSVVREDCDPKERFADPLLTQLGTNGPGRGRKLAMAALRGKYRSLRDTCTELRDLEGAIRSWTETR